MPGSWSVDMCDDYIVLPSSSIAVISFDISPGAIVEMDFCARWIFAPESAIDSMLLLGEFGVGPMQFLIPILGLLISILLIIIPNHHSHQFLLLSSQFL